MRSLRKIQRICAGRQPLQNQNVGQCLHGDKHIFWFNSGAILSVKCNRRLSSDSTVDVKSSKVSRKNHSDRNIKKRTVSQPAQPQVCSSVN